MLGLPWCPVVKTSPSSAGDEGSIPGQGAKITAPPMLCRGAKRLKRKEGANVFLWNLVNLHVECVSESGPPKWGKKHVHQEIVAETGEQGERRAWSPLPGTVLGLRLLPVLTLCLLH